MLIMLFHTSPRVANGSSTARIFCSQEKPNTCAASCCSRGTVWTERKKLKVMFQTWPVKIIRIAASSSPMLLCGKSATRASTSPGMNPSTGMLCRMSSSGTSTRSARWSLAAQ